MKSLFNIVLSALVALAAFTFTGCNAQKSADPVAQAEGLERLGLQTFMIQTSRLDFGSGRSTEVTPNTNFLMMAGGRCMVQVAPRIGGGPNGVGGITMDGVVSNYKLVRHDNGSATATFRLTQNGYFADVTISYDAKRNYALVRFSATYRRYSVTFAGTVSPYDPSKVVDGKSL